jgi:16S rRNA (guanine527-N7)-methyltransferase
MTSHGADATGPKAVAEFLRRCGVTPERLGRLDVLRRLYDALVEANRTTNLTRITDEAAYWHLHVADSLSVGLAVPELLREPLAVADVGCGAGFPLLPLAWANPNLRITGIESARKKVAFVRRQIEALALANGSVVAARAREAARLPAHAGRYEVVLARAVARADKLIRECRALLRPGAAARIVVYKTPDAVAEERDLATRQAAKFGLAIRESQIIDLPAASGRRQFLIATTDEG